MLFPPKKILCTTDFSDPSYEGLKTAGDLATQFGCEVVLVHVVSPVPVMGAPHHNAPMAFDVPGYQMEFVERTREALENVRQRRLDSSLTVHLRVEIGYAADEITRVAGEEGVDLIVIATHGHQGFQRFLLGSVTERVVRAAKCAVLSVRKPAPDA